MVGLPARSAGHFWAFRCTICTVPTRMVASEIWAFYSVSGGIPGSFAEPENCGANVGGSPSWRSDKRYDCWVSRRDTIRDAAQFRDAWAPHTIYLYLSMNLSIQTQRHKLSYIRSLTSDPGSDERKITLGCE